MDRKLCFREKAVIGWTNFSLYLRKISVCSYVEGPLKRLNLFREWLILFWDHQLYLQTKDEKFGWLSSFSCCCLLFVFIVKSGGKGCWCVFRLWLPFAAVGPLISTWHHSMPAPGYVLGSVFSQALSFWFTRCHLYPTETCVQYISILWVDFLPLGLILFSTHPRPSLSLSFFPLPAPPFPFHL